ncbi:MAG: hypothetical protein C0463_08225 [Idiomarina sp.]|nr:hypothetical protein [Idiomarina sp.]
MRKLMLASVLPVVCASSFASTSDTVQVFVGQKINSERSISISSLDVMQASLIAQQETRTECVPAGNTQHTWCLPVRERNIQILGAMTVQNGNVRPASTRNYRSTDVIEVERHGLSDQEILNAIAQTGLYEHVEMIGEMRSFNTSSSVQTEGAALGGADYGLFNDEWWPSQRISHYRVGDTWMSSGLASVMARGHQASSDRQTVFVIDGGFSHSDDMPYAGGKNFVSWGDYNRWDYEDEFHPQGDVSGEDGHGLGVSSIIAATRGNDSGIAGIADNVDIYAIRTLVNGSGGSLDTYEALLWLAGHPSEGITGVYEGKPGVINMSLGAKVEFGENFHPGEGNPSCGSAFQEVVDELLDLGFVLVAAVGNDNEDGWNTAPASCDGVIAVGAMSTQGRKAGWSNYGSLVDVFAPGTNIYTKVHTRGDVDDVYVGAVMGTSIASPVVAGLIAETKRHFDFTGREAQTLLRQTAFDHTLAGSCIDNLCGAGRIDGEAFFLAAEALHNGRLHSISHALTNVSDDEQAWLIDNFNAQGSACEAYQVDFFNGNSQAGQTYRVVEAPKGADFNTGGYSEVGSYTAGSVVLQGLNPDANDYAFQVCTEDGDCGDEWHVFNTQNAQSAARPEVCTG